MSCNQRDSIRIINFMNLCANIVKGKIVYGPAKYVCIYWLLTLLYTMMSLVDITTVEVHSYLHRMFVSIGGFVRASQKICLSIWARHLCILYAEYFAVNTEF